ncbi:MAG: hypothetical protein A4S09_07850 [Proteobacteria bacterium SG_bin7]|nr:MAG: hypothetical protein A4S09_07850 [Proteobacteria bacterium SG_bin7]
MKSNLFIFLHLNLLSIFVVSFSYSQEYNYATLDELYDNGTQSSFEEVTGWWSGRCFQKDEPNKPLAFLLMAAETDAKHLAIVSDFESDSAPDRYDQLSETDRAIFERFMNSQEFKSMEVSFADNAIYSHLGRGVQAIKKSGNQFVGVLRHSLDKDYNYNCFFFKKVK